MSNALAIASVTATLRHLLSKGVPGLNDNITTKPLDKAIPGTATPDQLNVFLYQTVLNAAWRNMDMPRQVRSGETSQPPLGLNLHYLITAFGAGDNEVFSHRWLGEAMSVLYDHPLLGAQEIQNMVQNDQDDSKLQLQIERVRITPLALSVEEISKLWTAFQTQYRVSAAYEVSVVLIESTRPTSSPLPVLKRGSQDQGVFSVPSPPASVSDVRPDLPLPGSRLSGQLGDDLTVNGQNFPGDGIAIRFTRQPVPASPAEPEIVNLAPQAGGDENAIKVSLTNDSAAMSKWAPGFYTVSLVLTLPGPVLWATNEAPFALAPMITIVPTNTPAGDVTLTVTCAPRLRDGQRVLLLFADRQIPMKTISNPADTTKPTTLTFLVPAVTKGMYVVRLRVDGVDSSPIVRTGTPPILGFDPSQTVTIT